MICNYNAFFHSNETSKIHKSFPFTANLAPKVYFLLVPETSTAHRTCILQSSHNYPARQILIKVGHSSTELGTGGKITQSTCGLLNHII